MLAAPDGYRWVATFDGVPRFDGVRFRAVERAGGGAGGRVWVEATPDWLLRVDPATDQGEV